jgi:hypothetical protein
LNAIAVACNVPSVRVLGRIIRTLRDGKRLSQREVATKGRLSSASRVSELENGSDVQISTLVGVMRGLELSAHDLAQAFGETIYRKAGVLGGKGKPLGDDRVTGLESLLPIAGPNAQKPGGVAMNEWEKVTWRRYASALGRLGHLDHAAQERFVADVDQRATEMLNAPARHRRLGK